MTVGRFRVNASQAQPTRCLDPAAPPREQPSVENLQPELRPKRPNKSSASARNA
jgi:hypothetical protein